MRLPRHVPRHLEVRRVGEDVLHVAGQEPAEAQPLRLQDRQVAEHRNPRGAGAGVLADQARHGEGLAALQLDRSQIVRLTDDAVGVEDVSKQVLWIAAIGPGEVRANFVPLTVELMADGTILLKDRLPRLAVARQFRELAEKAHTLGPPRWQEERDTEAERLEAEGVPSALAKEIALLPDLIHAQNIFELAKEHNRTITDVGRVYFRVAQALHLDDLEKVLANMTPISPWQRWARQTLDDDLTSVRRLLAERVLAEAGDASGDDAVDQFLAGRAQSLARV